MKSTPKFKYYVENCGQLHYEIYKGYSIDEFPFVVTEFYTFSEAKRFAISCARNDMSERRTEIYNIQDLKKVNIKTYKEQQEEIY